MTIGCVSVSISAFTMLYSCVSELIAAAAGPDPFAIFQASSGWLNNWVHGSWVKYVHDCLCWLLGRRCHGVIQLPVLISVSARCRTDNAGIWAKFHRRRFPGIHPKASMVVGIS